MKTETHEIQSRLASYCRTGIEVELPGITPNRLHHYRRLIVNIIEDNLESSFPIASEYIERKDWNKMVHQFITEHNCQSYQSWKIAGEFYEYTLNQKFSENFKIPYLNDLLKFEWEEMALYNMEDLIAPSFKLNGNFLIDKIVFNPEFKIIQTEYPIHLMNPILANEKKGNYFILLFREKISGSIQFMDISIWFAFIIEQLSKSEFSLIELITESQPLLGEINLEELKNTTLLFLEELKTKELLVGFKK